MVTAAQGLQILQDTIKGKLRHPDYDRTVELADLYYKLVTGDGVDTLLKAFVRRETDEEFAQRKALTVAVTPAVADSLMSPFYRLGRLDNIKRALNFPDNAENRRIKLEEKLNKFYGSQHLEAFLGSKLVQLNFTDPNAFILVDFDTFDYRVKTADPYPYIISSKNAINYSYKNNKLEWLIEHRIIDVPNAETGKKRKAEQYKLYLENEIIVAEQIVTDSTVPDSELLAQAFPMYKEWQTTDARKFQFQVYTPKGGMVQAVRVGYKEDLTTQGRTFVSPMQPAVPYFKKLIKDVSQMDLSIALHAFPQKIQRKVPCKGKPSDPCSGGVGQRTQATCTVCNGTGFEHHRSAQDVIDAPLPKHKDDVLPLNDLVYYVTQDTAILKIQDELVEKWEKKAVHAMYNSDIIQKTQFAQTATERIENKEEMQNTLYPFANCFSSTYKTLVTLVANFTDNGQGLEVLYEFPSDYKLKTVNEMIGELKLANDSGSAAFLKQEIEKDIARKVYADDEQAYKKYLVKTKFTPFMGKSFAEVQWIISSNKARKEDEVLWTHSDTIFDELEIEYPGFFDLSYDRQNALVTDKVKRIIEQLPKEALPELQLGETIETPVDVEAEAKANLKGSVGGVQGIIGIQESVAKGVTQYEAAVTLLYEIYGFEEAIARRLLGSPQALKAAKEEVTEGGSL